MTLVTLLWLKIIESLQNGCYPSWSDFIVFNERCVAGVITALTVY